LPTFINGGIAGTFSALPAGLIFVNTSTGKIDLSASNPSNYNVTNTVAAANGCPEASFTKVITVNAIPDAEFTYDGVSYCNENPSLTPNHATGVDGTYSATPAGLSINSATGVINIQASAPNTYTIQNVVAGSGSCPNDTKIFTLTIKPMPTVNPSSNSPVCKGEILNLSVATSPNTSGTTFSWTGPNSFTNQTQNPSIFPATPLASGNYTIQITSDNCTSFAILRDVQVKPNLQTNFGPSGPFCENQPSVNLTATDNGGTWSGTGITDNILGTFNPSIGTGSYMITYKNIVNCTLDSVLVTVREQPLPDFSVFPGEGCTPLNVVFTGVGNNPGDILAWDLGNGSVASGSNPLMVYTDPGCYDVSLTITRNGCTNVALKNNVVCVSPQAVANFSVTPGKADISYPLFQFTNESKGATNYIWNFSDGLNSTATNPSHLYQNGKSGIIEVTLIASNAGGCDDTIKKTIEIIENLLYFIPNTFTPDADKFNQEFRPIFTSGFDPSTYIMQVFNRWGELIFESRDSRIGWDGTYLNKLCADGVYTWKVIFDETKTGDRTVKSGTVNLLR
jgi:gliding motility-associated-like protein